MNKFLILVVLFAAGCSAETVDSEKLDESYSGKIFKKYENGQKKEEENYKKTIRKAEKSREGDSRTPCWARRGKAAALQWQQ